MTLTYGSLFSGVGGFDMGFDQAGYDCVFQVEWDKHCQQILAKHWPEVPKWSDVQEVNGAEIPPCDVLTFGSPCQDLSVAGKRAGLDGGRSSMFYEATRIIKEMRNATKSVYPRVVVWENVPGALSSNNGADFGQVLDTLADIGAVDIHWAVLDAQHFGVPQRRRRIFVVAIFDPAAADNCPETLLPVTKGSRGDFKKSRTAKQNPARTINESINTGDEQTRLTPVAYSIREDAKANNFSVTETDVDLCLNGLVPSTQSHHAQIFIAEPQPIIFENSYRDGPRVGKDICHTLPAKMGLGGGNTPMIAEVTYAFDTQFGSNAAVFEDTSPTLKSSQQPPSVSPPGLAVRRLTPLECERLMGWPDDHTRWTADGKEQADTNRYKQCGNGVATPVARWIAQHIKALL